MKKLNIFLEKVYVNMFRYYYYLNYNNLYIDIF